MNNKCVKVCVFLSIVLLATAGVGQDNKARALVAEKTPASSGATSNVGLARTAENYKIGAGDLLSINIWKEAELSRIVPVRPDGKISMPLIGEVEVSGATVQQLQSKLATAYRDYVKNPEVTVIVQEARSQRFNVVGQVQRPGSFVISQPTTVLDAIALVGGFRDFAKTKKIYVLRPNGTGTPDRLAFNYNKVVKGESPQQNIVLQSGDTVVVP